MFWVKVLLFFFALLLALGFCAAGSFGFWFVIEKKYGTGGVKRIKIAALCGSLILLIISVVLLIQEW